MVNTWLLRRYKRRVLCIISAIGMSICMGISGYFTLQIQQNYFDNPSANLVPVIGLLMFVVMSMVGFLTIPWTSMLIIISSNFIFIFIYLIIN